MIYTAKKINFKCIYFENKQEYYMHIFIFILNNLLNMRKNTLKN